MNIGNIYKKLCTIMILVGLILCSGQCVYAHSDELIEAIATFGQNQTIENLEYLAYLFEEDTQYHSSRGDYIEANRSNALYVSIKAKIAIKSHVNPTEEDYKKIIKLLQLETELWNNLGDNERAIDSLTSMRQYQAKLGELRLSNALLRIQLNSVAENWEIASKLSKEQSILYNIAGDINKSKYFLAKSRQSKATAAFFRAKNNSTVENWTKTAMLYGEASSIYCKIGSLSSASLCINEFIYASNMVIKLGGRPIIPPTELVYLYFE